MRAIARIAPHGGLGPPSEPEHTGDERQDGTGGQRGTPPSGMVGDHLQHDGGQRRDYMPGHGRGAGARAVDRAGQPLRHAYRHRERDQAACQDAGKPAQGAQPEPGLIGWWMHSRRD